MKLEIIMLSSPGSERQLSHVFSHMWILYFNVYIHVDTYRTIDHELSVGNM